MPNKVDLSTPPGTMAPIGPYSHIARSGDFIMIGAVAGVDPATGKLAEGDVGSQTLQIIRAFEAMLAAAGSDLAHVMHITVFLKHMRDFETMNRAYESAMRGHRPARSVVSVADLPKPGALVTMNLTAVTAE